MFRTTFASIAARKLRLAATSAAVLLGVAFMVGTLVLTDTVGRTFHDLYADAHAGTDTWVRGEAQFSTTDFGAQRARIDADLLEVVGAVDGVAVAEPVIESYAQIVGADGEAIGNPAWGAPTVGANWHLTEQLNPFALVEGRAPVTAGEVVIDRGSARSGGLVVGDRTTVLTESGPVATEVVGIATFGSVDSPGGASYALFATDVAAGLLGDPATVDAIAVVAEVGHDEAGLAAAVDARMPDGVEAISGSELVAETQSEVSQALGFFNTFMLVFALVALFVGSFIIYNTFTILVAQRTREHALLRAIGASRRQILCSVVLEAAAVGLVASLAGLAVGVGVASLLQGLLGALGIDLPAEGVVLTGRTIVVSMAAGLGISVAAAVLPARRAARVAPVAALRDTALGISGTSRPRVVAGLATVASGAAAIGAGLFGGAGIAAVGAGALAVFVGIAVLGPIIAGPVSRVLGAPLPHLRGVTGLLARQNAVRNPKRTASTAAALMVGVALVGSITIVGASVRSSIDDIFDRTFTGDVVVESGSFLSGGFDIALAAELDALAEVEAAMGLRATVAQVQGREQLLFAGDPAAVEAVFDMGVTAGSAADLGADRIAVLETVADRDGLGLGDTVEVRFAETGLQSLIVAAIYAEEQPAGNYFLGTPAFEANVRGQFDSTIYLAVADGVDPPDAVATVEAATAAYPQATVLDVDEYKAAQGAQLDPIFNLVYALLGLAVLIALLGIANTLALSVLERTRELGLLRAVGMTRGQVRSLVRWESVLIALLGTTLGLGVGTGFGWALVEALRAEGLTSFVVPVTPLAVIAGLAAAAGVVAALLPARRAARLDVLGAINAD